MMKFVICLMLLFLTPLSAKIEKDLNLAVLKKAHHWLALVAAEEHAQQPDKLKESADLTNVENAWDNYKDLMRQSIVLIRKYPRKVTEKLSELLTLENKDILPMIAFYIYTTERKDKTFRCYDAFNVTVVPANQENLWVALIPFAGADGSKHTNYSVLIMDLNNNRILVKD
jgi:hypothetical protein